MSAFSQTVFARRSISFATRTDLHLGKENAQTARNKSYAQICAVLMLDKLTSETIWAPHLAYKHEQGFREDNN